MSISSHDHNNAQASQGRDGLKQQIVETRLVGVGNTGKKKGRHQGGPLIVRAGLTSLLLGLVASSER